MRRYIKKEVLELLQTIKTASSKVGMLLEKGNKELLQAYLTECQEAAIQAGSTIEEAGEEGAEAVKHLEDYCELLYQILTEEKDYSEALMDKIEKAFAVIDVLPEKKEVVFLPYKASMWDSLESVWMTVRDDVNCDAYVVPIPYFDKKADGSLGEMHYEGNEYPGYVPITSWERYDISSRRPDVIYIHNPYDDWNFVTSVHPAFYAKELKKYTEQLIYIPYFVLQEIEPDNHAVIDGIKHFCFLPGTIYADCVIVQSENMKQIYVNEFLKAAEKNNLTVDRKELEKKFLGLGSPKFDKIQNTRKENLEIPEEWMRIIQRPDGTQKRIIFYNNSISALLKNDEKMLIKIKDILSIFKENQNEIALLWRPHPLMESTIKAMRSNLWIRYCELVERYRVEKWGIYDDTANLERAVILADAYYGDKSSIVQLFQKCGKPVMILNCEVLRNKADSRNLLEDFDLMVNNRQGGF